MSLYQQRIREELEAMQLPAHDPRHVEAWMRVEHSTLDHLDGWAFRYAIRMAVLCLLAAGPEESEACAQSYGL